MELVVLWLFQAVFLIFYISTCVISAPQDLENVCITPQEGPGRCVEVDNCTSFVNILKGNTNNADITVLLNYTCGFNGEKVKVCCPKYQEVILNNTQTTGLFAGRLGGLQECTTPTSRPGTCINIRQCGPYVKLLSKQPVSTEDSVLIRNSHCGFQGLDPKVCCPDEDETVTNFPTVLTTIVPDRNSDFCLTPRNEQGSCMDISKCDPYVVILSRKPIAQENVKLIRDSYCGLNKDRPKVCCPVVQSKRPSESGSSNAGNSINSSSLFEETANENYPYLKPVRNSSCTTPYGETAECISLYHCYTMASAIATQNKTLMEFVRESQCTSTDPKAEGMFVCCGNTPNLNRDVGYRYMESDPVRQPTRASGDRDNGLASHRICGQQQRDDRPKTKHNTTTTDEFPWLALLQYEGKHRDEPRSFRCSGTVIGRKHVLTAAHCTTLPFKLVSVRLGEYNPHSEEDCLHNINYRDCSYPVVDIVIKKIIPHPEFNRLTNHNNIALLVLHGNIFYTEYIRPICLPQPGNNLARPGDWLITSGWGDLMNYEDKLYHRKKMAFNQIITTEECKALFEEKRINITEENICAQEDQREASCRLDGGGPLMNLEEFRWRVEGIIVGALGQICGEPTVGVYTKVANYLDWINDNAI